MLTQIFENLLNRNLAGSPAARELCAQLRGQTLAVHADTANFSVGIESCGDSLKLLRPAPEAVAACLRGSPISLVALAGPDPEQIIRRGDVRIDGDAEIAQQFQRLLALLRPDLTDELARFAGDVAAHRLARLAGSAASYGRQTATTAVRNTFEYLAHEKGDLVPRAEGEAFYQDVEQLRDDAARLASRLTVLEERR
jgi:ubiquinone biosynthesis accessory factor UbiJ